MKGSRGPTSLIHSFSNAAVPGCDRDASNQAATTCITKVTDRILPKITKKLRVAAIDFGCSCCQCNDRGLVLNVRLVVGVFFSHYSMYAVSFQIIRRAEGVVVIFPPFLSVVKLDVARVRSICCINHFRYRCSFLARYMRLDWG